MSLAAPVLLAVAVGAAATLVQQYLKWVRTASMPEQLRTALLAIGDVAALCVAHAWQTRVSLLKDPTRPGEWNPVVALETKTTVTDDVKALARSPLDTLRDTGMSDSDVSRVVDRAVERAVVDLKNSAVPVTKNSAVATSSATSSPVVTATSSGSAG